MTHDADDLIQQAVAEALQAHSHHAGEGLCYAHLWTDPTFESQLLNFAGGAVTLWRDADFPERFLLLAMGFPAHEEDPISRGLDSAHGQAMIRSAYGPPDHVSITLVNQRGKLAAQVPVGSFVSIGMRTADSGQSDVLVDDVDNILDSLQYLDGHLGSAFGTRTGLDEEVASLVFWKDRESFSASTPRGSFYEIRLFSRIA